MSKKSDLREQNENKNNTAPVVTFKLPLAKRVGSHIDNADYCLQGASDDSWHSPGFDLCRRLMAELEFRRLQPGDARLLLEQCLEELDMTWDDLEERMLETDPEVEVETCWAIIKFPYGEDPLTQAIDRAKQTHKEIRSLNGYCLFLRICKELSIVNVDAPSVLPEQRLGEELQLSPRTISNYRSKACRDRLLQVQKSHSRLEHRATAFFIDRVRVDQEISRLMEARSEDEYSEWH